MTAKIRSCLVSFAIPDSQVTGASPKDVDIGENHRLAGPGPSNCVREGHDASAHGIGRRLSFEKLPKSKLKPKRRPNSCGASGEDIPLENEYSYRAIFCSTRNFRSWAQRNPLVDSPGTHLSSSPNWCSFCELGSQSLAAKSVSECCAGGGYLRTFIRTATKPPRLINYPKQAWNTDNSCSDFSNREAILAIVRDDDPPPTICQPMAGTWESKASDRIVIRRLGDAGDGQARSAHRKRPAIPEGRHRR